MIDTLTLTKQLVACRSTTPEDAGCQELLIQRLEKLGFSITRLPFGDVKNFWACRNSDNNSSSNPLFCFAGHTDVVPTGPLEQWICDPFKATEKGGLLYGRGTADMKGSLAAMITATEAFVQEHPNHVGNIAFLITSDEEGDAVNGTVKVIEWLQKQGKHIDYCLVGEPSSSEELGDVIKIGRRGSLSGTLTINGKQGHVAYPQLADNPIHSASHAIADLCSQEWDQGNAEFPPTSFQISNINAGTGANNVIPGDLKVMFNFRYSTETTEQALRTRVENILDKHKLDYELNWNLSGHPFLTTGKILTQAVSAAIKDTCNRQTQCSTGGGTSDGRFIAPTGSEVVELGPLNNSIHKVNECVSIADLKQLTQVYKAVLQEILA